MSTMTVKQLREALEAFPDDMAVVVSRDEGGEHWLQRPVLQTVLAGQAGPAAFKLPLYSAAPYADVLLLE